MGNLAIMTEKNKPSADIPESGPEQAVDPAAKEENSIADQPDQEMVLSEKEESPDTASLQTGHQVGDEADKQENQYPEKGDEALLALIEIVEEAIDSEDRSGLEKKVRKTREKWERISPSSHPGKNALEARFEDAVSRFFQKQKEYWEELKWERWANLTRKEELCVLVESFSQMEIPVGVARMVMDAQKKWKEIGPVEREKSEEIWSRFRSACDQAFDLCFKYKKALCEDAGKEIIPFLEKDTAEEVEAKELKAAAETVKQIQNKWNQVGYLPQSIEKNLRRDFQTLCNRFFEFQRSFFQQLDGQREENLREKQKLCEQAEALQDSEEWAETSRILKNLQKKWKKTGPIPKEYGDTLWERFQDACNGFFNRLEAEKPKNQKIKDELCKQAEECLEKAKTMENPESQKSRFIELQNQWKEIGPVTDSESRALWKRFRSTCDSYFEYLKSYKEEMSSLFEENRQKKISLIRQAEDLIYSEDWKTSGEKLADLQNQWKEIGTSGRKDDQRLWKEFRNTCDMFFKRRRDHFEEKDKKRKDNQEIKEFLCLSLELLARLIYPEKQIETGNSTPAEQLSLGLEYKNDVLVPGDRKQTFDRAMRKVREIQARWKETGPVSQAMDSELWLRYRKALDIFYSSRNGNN